MPGLQAVSAVQRALHKAQHLTDLCEISHAVVSPHQLHWLLISKRDIKYNFNISLYPVWPVFPRFCCFSNGKMTMVFKVKKDLFISSVSDLDLPASNGEETEEFLFTTFS